MKLTCPECGFVGSVMAWLNDAEARQAMKAATELPKEVQAALYSYLGLFRPEKRALTWKKVHRLIADIAKLVGKSHVQIRGQVARPCPPAIWRQAMEEMAGNPTIRRPLKNHNYLLQKVWPMADQADAKAEKSRENDLKNPHRRPESEPEAVDFGTVSDAEFSRLPQKLQDKYRYLREG